MVASLTLLAILSDSAFVNYAASMNVQLAALSGVVLATIGALLISHESPRNRILGIITISSGGILSVGAEPVCALLAIPFAGVLFFSAGSWRQWRFTSSRSLIPISMATVLVAFSVYMAWSEDSRLREIHAYDHLFVGVLGDESGRDEALSSLNLPKTLGRYAGESWWSASAARHDPAWDEYSEEVTPTSVAVLILTHPKATVQAATRATQEVLSFRPRGIGTFPISANLPPRSADCRWCVASAIGQLFANRSLLAIVLFIAMASLIGSALLRSGNPYKPYGVSICFLVGIVASGIVATALSDPLDSAKTAIIPAMAACMIPVMLIGAWCASRKSAPQLRGSLYTKSLPRRCSESILVENVTHLPRKEACVLGSEGET
ncbi:hypothetical protein [Streptomyces sp. NPDC057686]|uniref:glycan biosynthesis hexose transferase WsfD n=1 Tax=Streptomyces sp. NPDC057686 TaxID=3346212 RepID=UPI0036ABB22D